MPEKRRKNNKNKRKNKNNRPEVSHSVSKETKKIIIDKDAVGNQSEPLTEKQINEQISLEIVDAVVEPTRQNVSSENQIQNITNISNSSTQVLIQNNNEESDKNTPSCNDSTLNLTNEQILDIGSEISTSYVVETPEQTVKSKPKISSAIKSKSLDSDEVPKIVEITEDIARQCEEENNLSIVNSCNVLVSDVESDVEWEETGDLNDSEESFTKNVATGTLSITTIPLDIAQCMQTKSLTPQEEISLRNYLKTLDLSTSPENIDSVEVKTEIEQIINREIKHRLRKKGITDELLVPRLGPSRVLDVIAEEGSGESSQNSRRQSYLSDKKSDSESIEDEVFEDKNASKQKFCTRALGPLRDVTFGPLVPQKCVLVGAKLKEPEVCEARGDWTMTTIEKMTGAEVVYLTDSSSSTSSLHEIGEDNDDGIESDVSIRMTTPTIEVTDTEKLLKNTFITAIDKPQTASDSIDKIPENENIKRIVKIEHEKDNCDTNNSSTQSSHEIVVLSTENIKTNLFVKDINELNHSEQNKYSEEITKIPSPPNTNQETVSKTKNEYDLEIKVIKCELNDAINNLIKEVTSDSEIVIDNSKDGFTRQDSSSSICSSQCTAKYNPNYSSLNDVSNLQPDEVSDNTPQDVGHSQNVNQEHKQINNVSHVKDVFETITRAARHTDNQVNNNVEQPSSLKDICLKRVASFPYGEKILEELASVSEKIQKISEKPHLQKPSKAPIPPPITPRNSSLKISQDDELRTTVSNKNDNMYVCMSPSQKMLMTKTKTVLPNDEPGELIYKPKFDSDKNVHKLHNSKKKTKVEEHVSISPPGPFKSQTGSRLLALICDPTITANVNSLKKHYNKSIEQLTKKITDTDVKPLINKEKTSTIRDFSNLFKPIPPPRSRKMSSSIYESDESSDFTDNSLRSMKKEKKVFHFSTGNLNKEIENDVSSIQNRHRFYTNISDQSHVLNVPRRPSLPKDLCDQQMEYIRLKEKEVEAEIKRLQETHNSFSNIARRGPRAPLISDKEIFEEKIKDANNYSLIHKRNVTVKSAGPEKIINDKSKMSSLFSSSQEELQREKMYSEYISQMAEREERKQHKIIKITNTPSPSKLISKSMSALDVLDSKVNNRIEEEFISKARKRWEKLGIRDPETEDESELHKSIYKEPLVIEHKIKVIESGQEKDVKKLPSHLQDFVHFTTKDKETSSSGESNSGPASPHVVIWCAVIIIVLAVGKYFLRLFRNN